MHFSWNNCNVGMLIVKTDGTCCRHAALTLQQALNEMDPSWPSKDARTLLDETKLSQDVSTGSLIIEHLNKPRQADACVRTMTDLPEVSCHSIINVVVSDFDQRVFAVLSN